MNEKEDIQNIITCGIRWGTGNPSYQKLSLDNNIAILGGENKHFKIPPKDTKSGILIALKDGFNIIALGMYKDKSAEIKWTEVFDTYIISENRKYTEEEKVELANKYHFNLEDSVITIEVEEWVILDPPIYYPNRVSTVNIRQDPIIEKCNNRFKQKQLDTEQHNEKLVQFNIQTAQGLLNTLNSEDNKDNKKRNILADALELVENALKFDSTNTEATNLKNAIESNPIFKKEQITKKRDTISRIQLISWGFSCIGIIILNYDRLGIYEITVNRMIFMGGILILAIIPSITSLKFGIFDINFEKKEEKEK